MYMDCINPSVTESIWVLKTQQKGSDVPFVSLLNSSVTRSQIVSSRVYAIGMLSNVHNVDGPMQ